MSFHFKLTGSRFDVQNCRIIAGLLFFKSQVMENNITPTSVKQRKVKGKVEIEIQRCKACELCIKECKENALSLGESINLKGYRYIIANNDVCTGCVNCALVCPDAVITIYRTQVKKKNETT
jgi:2-oxoglutarate ferredoxin oxidoreductase subunit delta